MYTIRHIIPIYFIAPTDQECWFITFTLSSRYQSEIVVSIPALSNHTHTSSFSIGVLSYTNINLDVVHLYSMQNTRENLNMESCFLKK